MGEGTFSRVELLKTHWRLICWPPALLMAAAAVVWALSEPGDAAYWIGGLLAVPALGLGVVEMEQAWPSMSATARVIVFATAVACAAVGLLYAVLSPGPKSNIVGGLLCLPVMAVLMPILMRDDDEDLHSPTEGPWGPPAA